MSQALTYFWCPDVFFGVPRWKSRPGVGPTRRHGSINGPAQAQRAKDETDIGATRRAYGFLFFEGDSSTRVRSVFPTGFPGLAAGFGGLFGESAVFWTNTLLLLGLAPAGGLIALRLTNRTGSIGTAVLLLLLPTPPLESRTGFAELMLAYLFLFGLWTLSEWDRKANPVPLALLFGTLPLVKLEGWLGTFAVGIVIIAGLRPDTPGRCCHSWPHTLSFWLWVAALLHRGGGGYTLDTLNSVLSTIPWHWLIPVALAALLPLGLRRKSQRLSFASADDTDESAPVTSAGDPCRFYNPDRDRLCLFPLAAACLECGGLLLLLAPRARNSQLEGIDDPPGSPGIFRSRA